MRESMAFLCCLLVGVLCLLVYPQMALAGVAPPGTAPEMAAASEDDLTGVVMASEEVLLEVEPLSSSGQSVLVEETMVGHVAADFAMVNEGEAAETLDVWFPLTTSDDRGRLVPVEGFQAWVNGRPANVTEVTAADPVASNPDGIWATWRVVFPPRERVLIRVIYDLYPTGDYPWGVFSYVLATSAGWHGPVGEGTIVFRLPYEVDARNVEIAGARATFEGFAAALGGVESEGRDVIWHFKDLEPLPGAAGSATLAVLAPEVWAALTAAQIETAAHPDDVHAYLELARTARAAMRWRVGPLDTGPNVALSAEIDRAYGRALELAPEDPEVAVAHLKWQARLLPNPDQAEEVIELPAGGMVPAAVLPALAHARDVAPDDPRVGETAEWLVEIGVLDGGRELILTDPPAFGVVGASGGPSVGTTATPTLAPTPRAQTVEGPNPTPAGLVDERPPEANPAPIPHTIEALDRSALGLMIGVILLSFVAMSLRAFDR